MDKCEEGKRSKPRTGKQASTIVLGQLTRHTKSRNIAQGWNGQLESI